MTDKKLKEIYMIRHGETEWTLSGKHTSTSDIALTEKGKKQAKALGARLKGKPFTKIFCSPTHRAKETCQLSGYPDKFVVDDDLAEWNYGQYEGITTAKIREEKTNWLLFTDGAPGGEAPKQVSARADRMIAKINQVNGDVAVFSHGHFLRILAARWLGLAVAEGRGFYISPAALSILGFEREVKVLRLWNDTSHLVLKNLT